MNIINVPYQATLRKEQIYNGQIKMFKIKVMAWQGVDFPENDLSNYEIVSCQHQP